MRARARAPRKQRGAALIVFAFVLVLGVSWMVVSGLGAAGNRTALDRAQNANVLQQVKAALIGYVAQQAAMSSENNPGRLPCPQAWGDLGTANEGRAAGNCTLPAVGWLPWRTLGLPKMTDVYGEQLWYVVSPGWALSNSTTPPLTTYINSDSPGQLSVDAQAVVALIIAPGPALSVQASANCAARSQARTASPPDLRDYLECENATSPADASFVTSGPSGSFNDQVLRVTAADLLPGIEAAIAKRIERDIVPQLKSVYAGSEWGLNATNPVFPFAAPFVNPGPGAGTSSFQGAAGTYQGLLPFNQTQGCNPATDPRCLTSLIAWSSPTPPDVTKIGGFGSFQTKTCSWQTPDIALCAGEYLEDATNPSGPGMVIQMSATLNNVAMGLRLLDTTKATIEAEDDVIAGTVTVTPSVTATMNSNGSVTITFSGALPNIDVMGWGTFATYRIRLERSVIGDHALLSSTNATTGWFVRNEWYRLAYYAIAPGHAASGTAPRSCEDTTPTCLAVGNVAPASKQRAILLLAGRSLNNATRPNGNLADYLDDVSGVSGIAADINRNGDTSFYQHRVSRTFNDRAIVVDANP